jgi:hypothetical protein
MGVGFGAIEADQTRWQIEPLERELRGSRRANGRRNNGRQRDNATDAAAIGADRIPCSIGRGGRLIGDNVMTNDVVGLRDGVGSRPRSAKIRNQAGERNDISGDQRNNALPQWARREPHAHNPSPTLIDPTNILAAKKFPRQPKSPLVPSGRAHCRLYIDPAVFGLTLRTHQLSACPCASCRHDLRSSCRCRFRQRRAQQLRSPQWGIRCQ